MRTLVLQHIACEPPGLFEDILLERGAAIHRVELDAGDPLPDWRSFDLIVAMGGPMSVNDDEELPWLRREKRMIAEAVGAGLPFWGSCLGVQLLAASLGARVYPGAEPEVGVLPVVLTDAALADPVFKDFPREILTVQWHGDTFDLPQGAIGLAGSSLYPNQAFRWKQAYGIQFHLELSSQMVREWAAVPAYAESLERVLGSGATERLITEVDAHVGELQVLGRRMFEHWLELTVGQSTGSSRASVPPWTH